MIENSTAGLTMLEPRHEVAVPREDSVRPALRGYAPRAWGRGRQVALELAFAPVPPFPHVGQRGIEVRLDGARVGELETPVSRRYGPLLENVLARGGRPGCVGEVRKGRRGIGVQLRLPEAPAEAAPLGPLPRGARTRRPGAGHHRAAAPVRPAFWIGAGVVTLLAVIGASTTGGGGGTATVTETAGSASAVEDARAAIAALGSGATSPSATSTSATDDADDATDTAGPTTAPAPVPAPPVPARRSSTAQRAHPSRPSSRRPNPPLAAADVQPAPARPTTAASVTTTPSAAATSKPTSEPTAGSASTTTTASASRSARPAAQASPGGCDPNYGGCVPIASDVDCAGGDGNGPKYVQGPVTITGSDIYELDGDDKDGIGCD